MAEKINPKTVPDAPLGVDELRAQSAVARGGEQPQTAEAVTPETQGGPIPRLAADIRAILRNKASEDARLEAEAKFDAEYADRADAELPQTLEAALIVTRDVLKDGELRDLPGFRAATPTAQDEFERVLMRPGTLVEATEDVYDAGDLSEKVTLFAGDRVPAGGVGFVSAHFIVEARRQRIIAGQ